jgi:flagellar M-ring protein FliF
MGFTAARGDSLNVTNTRFTTPEVEAMPEIPLWRQPENISLASQAGKYLLLAAVTLYAFFAFVRPLLKKASAAARAEPAAAGLAAPGAHALPDGTLALPHQAALMSPEEKLQAARLTARQDPRAVAGVVKNWVEG